MEFEEINPTIWKPEEKGDNIVGELVSKNKNVGVNLSNTYHIKTKEGVMMVWGSTILDQRLEFTELGNIVRITFEGMTENKRGQDVKLFKVERAKTKPTEPETLKVDKETI